jgi:hypothetical protein
LSTKYPVRSWLISFLWRVRGEQTAQALEANLTNLERRLDELLAEIDESEQRKVEAPNGDKTHGPGLGESKKS